MLVLVDVVVIVGLSEPYGICNAPGAINNPCNDPRWCCVQRIYEEPTNGCLNNYACTPPVSASDLRPNTDFLWLFWVNFSLLIVDALIALFFAVVFAYCPAYGSALGSSDNDYDDGDDEWDDTNGDPGDADAPDTTTVSTSKGMAAEFRAQSPTRSTTRERKK
jgi:hypothetical protein